MPKVNLLEQKENFLMQKAEGAGHTGSTLTQKVVMMVTSLQLQAARGLTQKAWVPFHPEMEATQKEKAHKL